MGKIGQADPKKHEANVSDLEDAIVNIAKHQEDMVEENIPEREVPIVDDVHHQGKVLVRVDTTTEANVSDSEGAVVKHQEDIVEENILEKVLQIVDNVHYQGNVLVRVDTTAEEIVR